MEKSPEEVHLRLERRLVCLAQRGDTRAFRELYSDNVETIFRYLSARVQFHEAEDLTAEVFCSAWQSLPTYEFRGTPFRAWLLTIAKNLLRSRARRHIVISETPSATGHVDAGEVGDAADGALRHAQADVVRGALESIKPEFREVLRLRFLAEMSVREVAERLGCSEENVRVRTFRALSQLRHVTRGKLA